MPKNEVKEHFSEIMSALGSNHPISPVNPNPNSLSSCRSMLLHPCGEGRPVLRQCKRRFI